MILIHLCLIITIRKIKCLAVFYRGKLYRAYIVKGGTNLSLKIVKEYSKVDQNWIVEIIGELDILTSVEFKKSLYDMLDEMESNIKLNCENLFYIDSTGLGVIIGVLNRVKNNNNNISIVNAQSNIDKLIKISGLDKVIGMEKTS